MWSSMPNFSPGVQQFARQYPHYGHTHTFTQMHWQTFTFIIKMAVVKQHKHQLENFFLLCVFISTFIPIFKHKMQLVSLSLSLFLSLTRG